MALAYAAAVTRAAGVCAWVDVADALDVESAATSGVELERLLWVRCGRSQQRPSVTVSEAPQAVAGSAAGTASLMRDAGGGSPHPRSEGRGMPQAITAMLEAHGGLYDKQVRRESKAIGATKMANRSLPVRSEEREEQVNSDRWPPRRGDNLAIVPRCAEPQPRRVASVHSGRRMAWKSSASVSAGGAKPWLALDQALRATDLLLQNGGFSAIVLDLGSTRPEFAWRIPLATWFRFRAACERTRVSLLLLTQHPCARSSAELVVRLQPGSFEAQSRVVTGVRYQGVAERSRSQESISRVVSIRKPPQTARRGEWRSEAAWAQVR
jgi:recombination protein RecA